MQANMLRTWKPTTAGILNIITGTVVALWALGIIIAIIAVDRINIMRFIPPEDASIIMPIIVPILVITLVFSIIEVVIPIIGGVFALQCRKWGWALAGSVVSILGILPLGIASTIFIAIAKDEFE